MLILKQGESPDHITARWATPEETLEAQKLELLEKIEAFNSSLRKLGEVTKTISEGMKALMRPSFKGKKRKIIRRLK